MPSTIVKCEETDPETAEESVLCGARARLAGEARGQLARVCAAEAAGTALLVLLLCLQAAHAGAVRAVGAGAAVSLLAHSLAHVSGAQLNPAVTLAAAILRRQTTTRAALEAGAQLAGAALGAAALLLLAPAALPPCCTRPAPHVADWRAACVEAACTACLVLANLAAWDERRAHHQDSWPLRLGVTVAALALAAGELSGASMNPARSLAPALISGDYGSQWVYWVGPLSGSLAATAMYQLLWAVPPAARVM